MRGNMDIIRNLFHQHKTIIVIVVFVCATNGIVANVLLFPDEIINFNSNALSDYVRTQTTFFPRALFGLGYVIYFFTLTAIVHLFTTQNMQKHAPEYTLGIALFTTALSLPAVPLVLEKIQSPVIAYIKYFSQFQVSFAIIALEMIAYILVAYFIASLGLRGVTGIKKMILS